MATETTQPDEARSQRAVRLTVSGLLVAEAALLTGVTVWIVVWVPMIMFAAVEPIAASVMLIIAAVHLFKGRRRILVAILCGSAVLLGAGPLFIQSQSDYGSFFLLAILIPIAGLIVALRMKPNVTTVKGPTTTDVVSANEDGLQKAARITVGILLGTEALLLLNLSLFITVIVPFIGGLAFIAGAGDASDSKIAQAWWTILAMVLVPWVVTASEAVASIHLLMRRRPTSVAILCLVTIILKILALMALFYEKRDELSLLVLLVFAAPAAGLALATFQLKQRTASV